MRYDTAGVGASVITPELVMSEMFGKTGGAGNENCLPRQYQWWAP